MFPAKAIMKSFLVVMALLHEQIAYENFIGTALSVDHYCN